MPVSSEKKLKVIDLFAGIGGIRLGFKLAFRDSEILGDYGDDPEDLIEFVYSNEIDTFSCQTYEANFRENPYGDITQIKDYSKIPDFDILLAGFPCQSFSLAGHKRGFEDVRGTLFFYVAEILKEKQPKVFLLENVKNLVTHDSGRTLQVIKDVLRFDLGYYIHLKVLNAKDFGIPQNRERIFIVGFRENLQFSFPDPVANKTTLTDILEPRGSVDPKYYLSHEYLSGLKKHRERHEKKGHGFGYEVRPRKGIANAIVCGGMGRERNLVKDDVLVDCWKTEGDNKRKRNGEGIRKMTPREWARLQGFPDTYIFPVSMTRSYKQLGNSVAVPVITAIAKEIRKSLEEGVLISQSNTDIGYKREAYELLLQLIKRKRIPKSGRLSHSGIKKFVESQYLRISSLKEILQYLDDMDIISLEKTFVKFREGLIIKDDVNLSLHNIENLFHLSEQESVVRKYQNNKIIPVFQDNKRKN